MIDINLNTKIVSLIVALLLIVSFNSCDDETSNYMDNPYTISGDIGLQYETLTTYSYQEIMNSAAPMFSIDNSAYNFSILSVKLDGTLMTDGLSIFNIDEKLGTVTIDNKNGNLVSGSSYSYDIGVGNVNGIIRNDAVFTLNVLDTPLDFAIDNSTFETNFLENANVGKVEFVDTSPSGDVLSNVSYSLVSPPAGFSINSSTGVISKTTAATSGTHLISVSIQTNVGSKTFSDILEVTVGAAPVMEYVQQDNVTLLTNVVLSPWTAYTTSIPVLEGMSAVDYDIILPATLAGGSVIANSDGSISVLADQNLPIGTHVLGVKATNSSGISADFDAIFSLTVESRWDETPVFYEDFNNPTEIGISVNSHNSALNSYALNGTATHFLLGENVAKERDIHAVKISDASASDPIDGAMVVELTMESDWRGMRVSFSETFGFGSNRIDSFERSFSSSHNITDLLGGTYDNNNWDVIMTPTDSSWSGDAWTTSSTDANMNKIPFKSVNIIPGNTSIFLNWRVEKTSSITQKSVFWFDSINIEVSTAFAAEEQ